MTYIFLLSFHWSELITWSPCECREVGKYIGAHEYTVSKMISATHTIFSRKTLAISMFMDLKKKNHSVVTKDAQTTCLHGMIQVNFETL